MIPRLTDLPEFTHAAEASVQLEYANWISVISRGQSFVGRALPRQPCSLRGDQ